VHRSILQEFSERVVARARQFAPGNPLDPATTMPAMVTAEHEKRVMGYIDKGRSEGARLLCGGNRLPGPGSFIEPTVFSDLTPAMTIAREEIFGPVLGILPVDSLDQALDIARDTDFGLHASVFTQDIDRALRLARGLPCGTVSVNAFSEGDVKTPFGGYKRSGSLARDNGAEAMDQYLQTKTIWIALK
jgi:aldehyde dehydrogenase (NAD+)/gamma-glutamyl-gamma-aminobutyraldehyde dehydrogenase